MTPHLHRLARPEVQQTMQSRAAGFCRRQKKGSAGKESRSVLPKAKKPCWSAVARETRHLHRVAQAMERVRFRHRRRSARGMPSCVKPEVKSDNVVERSRLRATALRGYFFACGEVAPPSLPALAYPGAGKRRQRKQVGFAEGKEALLECRRA